MNFFCDNICSGESCHHPPVEMPFYVWVMPSPATENEAHFYLHLKMHFQRWFNCYNNLTSLVAMGYILNRSLKKGELLQIFFVFAKG